MHWSRASKEYLTNLYNTSGGFFHPRLGGGPSVTQCKIVLPGRNHSKTKTRWELYRYECKQYGRSTCQATFGLSILSRVGKLVGTIYYSRCFGRSPYEKLMVQLVVEGFLQTSKKSVSSKIQMKHNETMSWFLCSPWIAELTHAHRSCTKRQSLKSSKSYTERDFLSPNLRSLTMSHGCLFWGLFAFFLDAPC